MGVRQVVKGSLPTAVLNGLKRGPAVRRAGARFGLSELLSPRRARCLELCKIPYLPPGAARPGGVVVDVGAHEGRWAEAALRTLRPERLYAIEPSPATFARLAERLGEGPGLELVQCAVGDHIGEAELHLTNSSDFNSLLPLHPGTASHYSALRETGTVSVPLHTLDELLINVGTVQVLKIDVQGAESAVLRGASAVLGRTQAVILETNFLSHYEGDDLFCDLHARMTASEFDLYRLASEYHDGGGRLLWADAIYAHRGLL